MIHPKEYSLWIVPSESIFEKLAAIISRLSKQYSTPCFEPHVTVLGDITLRKEELLFKTAEIETIHILKTVSFFEKFLDSSIFYDYQPLIINDITAKGGDDEDNI